MGSYTTKPVREISLAEFMDFVREKNVMLSAHAFDHLSSTERKVFKREELIDSIVKETPRRVYLQQNGRYAAYFRRKNNYRKIIVEEENNKLIIVSYMDTPELPRLNLK